METNKSIQLYTSGEVANILKMNPQVIARKLQTGEMQGYKIGKDWRVSHEQLVAFLEKHSNKRVLENPQEKVIRSFFENGKLKSIPTTRHKRETILRHLISQLEPDRVYSEKEINKFISKFHTDVCTIRREFIINKLMVRNAGKYKVASWNLVKHM
jgi:excisionase family DNA binding protein